MPYNDDEFPAPHTADAGHVSVLPREVLHYLSPSPGRVCVDCTVGRAGHARLIVPRLAPGGRYIALDVDPVNVAYAQEQLRDPPVRVDVVRSNFADVASVLSGLGVGQADLLLADLGFASNQMGDASRGLSFTDEGPLDMRLDPDLPRTAADLVNELPPHELADVIYRYGEERLSRKIARKIADKRQEKPILTTSELADVIRRSYGALGRHSRIDPATRTFMALRIAVNQELAALEQLLADLPRVIKPGGVAAIISFHSLEDRLVKQAFAQLAKDGQGTRLTPKPVQAQEDETRTNPRSRSAKLRAWKRA